MPKQPLRILDTDGRLAGGETEPRIGRKKLLDAYRTMVLSRLVDERMIKLQRQGRISFYIGSVGEEAAIVGSALALKENDWIVPCYRELGAAFLRGYSLYELFCQLFGNAEDPQKGRQMPNHWCMKQQRITSISSPVGTQIPHATGIGMAARIAGSKDVVLVYFGDGATSEGDFHYGCNFAGVYKAPVIFFCRNNQWAISVPLEQQTASETLAIKSKAYGLEGVRVDGNDLMAVYAATSAAARRARAGQGATLIEALTYRQGAHSTSDDPRAYREDQEVEKWKKKDPIARLSTYLKVKGLWDDERERHLRKSIQDEIQTTLKKVEPIGPAPVESLFEDVFDKVPWNLDEQRDLVLEAITSKSGH